MPLKEPAAVDLRAKMNPDIKPSELQDLLEPRRHGRPTRNKPHISLEEIDDEEVVMRISAIPESDEDGPG